MRIALLYPGIVLDGFMKDGVRPKTGWIQHGLCYISAALKEKGHEVSLIDLRHLRGWEDLPSLVRRLSPDIVGITALTLDYNVAVESARIIKEADANIKTVVGGPHPTLAAEEFVDNPNIDYIFKGEAEVTLPKMAENMRDGSLKEKIITGEPPDLSKIPFPDRNLFSVLEVPPVPFLKMPFITSMPGRGCPYNCSFCQPAEKLIHSAKPRRIPVERFMEELELVRSTIGMNTLMIHDDCLAEDVPWVEKFLSEFSKRRFSKSFTCQSRADIIVKHRGLFKDMRRHGLQMVSIGFESGSQRILNFLRKGTKVEHNYEAARICNSLGIRVWANYMFGIPTETNKEAAETVKMIKRIKPYVASPAFYVPSPGSDLYKYCIDQDLSLIQKYEDYKRNPDRCNIRNIDYNFMKRALADTVKIPYSVKLRRKIDKLMLRHFNKDIIRNYELPSPV